MSFEDLSPQTKEMLKAIWADAGSKASKPDGWNECRATYAHHAHRVEGRKVSCAGMEEPPGRDLNGGEVYYFEFYHEVNDRYGVSIDDGDVIRIWMDGTVEFSDGTSETISWDCIREYSDR